MGSLCACVHIHAHIPGICNICAIPRITQFTIDRICCLLAHLDMFQDYI